MLQSGGTCPPTVAAHALPQGRLQHEGGLTQRAPLHAWLPNPLGGGLLVRSSWWGKFWPVLLFNNRHVALQLQLLEVQALSMDAMTVLIFTKFSFLATKCDGWRAVGKNLYLICHSYVYKYYRGARCDATVDSTVLCRIGYGNLSLQWDRRRSSLYAVASP